MSQENNGLGALAIGCALGAVLLAGGAFLLFGVSSVSPAPGGPLPGGPSAPIERGFRITGGELLQEVEGQQKFAVDVGVEEGWTVTGFELEAMQMITSKGAFPCVVIGAFPELPTEESFRLTFQCALPQPGPEDPAPRFQLEIQSKTTTGFFGRKVQSDSSTILEFEGDQLVPR